jgi:hypothetical protein
MYFIVMEALRAWMASITGVEMLRPRRIIMWGFAWVRDGCFGAD